MNRRALIMALIVAMLGGALLVFYLRRFEEEKSGGEPVELLAAVKPIAAGELITEDKLATRIVPRAYVEDRAVLAAERGKVIGLRLGHTLQAQQMLMWTDLNIAMEERRTLSALVQPGMRAVTVRAGDSDLEKSFALIRPGDRTDVLLTMASGGGPVPITPGAGQRTAIVLLQNVLVLAVGSDTGAEPGAGQVLGKNERQDIILSLSLNIPEAQLLTLATEKGNIAVALRNPDDVLVTEGISDVSDTALQDSKARTQVTNVRRGPVGPKEIKAQPAER
jgi:pilus assembly protein CpaB